MATFLCNAILWILALYGLFEITKTIFWICTYTRQKADGIYVIFAVKNQEERLEGFMRTFLFRLLYGTEENIKEIMIADLDSTDHTYEVATKLEAEYDNISIRKWRECKEILDEIDG